MKVKNEIQDLFYILAFEVLVYLYNLYLSYSYYVCHCTIFFQIFSQLLCIFLYSEYIMKRKILFYLIVLSFFYVPIRFTSSLPSKMKNVHTVFQILLKTSFIDGYGYFYFDYFWIPLFFV